MKPRRAGLAGLAVVALACSACGHAASRNTQIRLALEGSPKTYFAYRATANWGRPVDVQAMRIRLSNLDSSYAGARIEVRTRSGRLVAAQNALLRNANAWRVVDTSPADSPLRCSRAPAGVVRALFGRCDSSEFVPDALMIVSGPYDRRQPTARERATLQAAQYALWFAGRGVPARCLSYDIRVSRLNPRYAHVEPVFATDKVCLHYAGNGGTNWKRSGGRWREVVSGSDVLDCRYAPAGVLRSLDGECVIYRRRPR